MTKQELRASVKKLLKETQMDFNNTSRSICDSLYKSPLYACSDIVLGYMALGDEVDVSFLLEKACIEGKKVYIPRILPDTNLMDFYDYSSAKNEGSFGISEPEPAEECKFIPEAADEHKVLMLVPGRAFDKQRNRLGRGKGFYDIYISRLKESIKAVTLAGICFDLQLIETVPAEKHDIPMDCVITENGILK